MEHLSNLCWPVLYKMESGFVPGYIYLMLRAQSADCMANGTHYAGPVLGLLLHLHLYLHYSPGDKCQP